MNSDMVLPVRARMRASTSTPKGRCNCHKANQPLGTQGVVQTHSSLPHHSRPAVRKAPPRMPKSSLRATTANCGFSPQRASRGCLPRSPRPRTAASAAASSAAAGGILGRKATRTRCAARTTCSPRRTAPEGSVRSLPFIVHGSRWNGEQADREMETYGSAVCGSGQGGGRCDPYCTGRRQNGRKLLRRLGSLEWR